MGVLNRFFAGASFFVLSSCFVADARMVNSRVALKSTSNNLPAAPSAGENVNSEKASISEKKVISNGSAESRQDENSKKSTVKNSTEKKVNYSGNDKSSKTSMQTDTKKVADSSNDNSKKSAVSNKSAGSQSSVVKKNGSTVKGKINKSPIDSVDPDVGTVDSGSETSPENWSVENSKNDDMGNEASFASIQQPVSENKDLDKAKWLFYGGVGLILLSLLGLAFFTIVLLRNRKKLAMKRDFDSEEEEIE